MHPPTPSHTKLNDGRKSHNNHLYIRRIPNPPNNGTKPHQKLAFRSNGFGG
jgi:hypothetical protein